MQIKLPYGNTEILFEAPERANVLYSNIDRLKSSESGQDIVRIAMAAPIDSPPLRELAMGKKTCTLIISDHTRPVPSRDILPPMLEELRAGNPDIEITLLVATGFHRLTTDGELRRKLGDEIFEKELKGMRNYHPWDKELDVLLRLGKCLGELDKHTQILQLSIAEEELSSLIHEAEEEKRTKGKLYRTLGVCMGMLSVILIMSYPNNRNQKAAGRKAYDNCNHF